MKTGNEDGIQCRRHKYPHFALCGLSCSPSRRRPSSRPSIASTLHADGCNRSNSILLSSVTLSTVVPVMVPGFEIAADISDNCGYSSSTSVHLINSKNDISDCLALLFLRLQPRRPMVCKACSKPHLHSSMHSLLNSIMKRPGKICPPAPCSNVSGASSSVQNTATSAAYIARSRRLALLTN